MRALVTHLFGLRGRVGRAALWRLMIVRTMLGIGLVQMSVTDATWDDAYKLAAGAILFWPTRVALPIKRLNDLGFTWRSWAMVWGATLLLAAPAIILGCRSGQGEATAFIGPVPFGLSISPDAVPPAAVMLLLCAAIIQLLYGFCLYFVGGRDRAETRRQGHALTS